MVDLQPVIRVPRLPPRKPDAHKGLFGRILIIGGSRGMIGAPALAANSALRAGAGLVTLAVPDIIQPTCAGLAWCATSIPLPTAKEGWIAPRALSLLTTEIVVEKKFDVVAVGPGLDKAEFSNALARQLVEADVPLVIDADGLNNLSRIAWHGLLAGRCVITPHPGELSRLLEKPTQDIQADRIGAACRTVELMTNGQFDKGAVCVLKGDRTVVTDGRRLYINTTGNPGMASGGIGDVLTGVIAALLGQKLDPFGAAVLGVYVHGRAGDLAARALSQVSLTAEDVLDRLPQAFKVVGNG